MVEGNTLSERGIKLLESIGSKDGVLARSRRIPTKAHLPIPKEGPLPIELVKELDLAPA